MMVETSLRDHFCTIGDPGVLFGHLENAYTVEIEGSPREVMNLWSWTIPGMGFAADYCMRQKVSAVSTTKDAIKVTRLKCGRVQCPNCYEWWMSERVFDTAVRIIAYSRAHKLTPLALSVSEHPDAVVDYTWQDYQKSFRRMYRRMKLRNIDGGYRVFHPYRIQERYKNELREMGFNKSRGFWKGVRANVLGLPSWYYYTKLAPHLHIIGFSNWVDECTDTDIVIKKYADLYEVSDVVAHIRYLLTHAGILADEDTSKPTMPWGSMHKFVMEDHLTPEQILQIKQEVAEAMGVSYNQGKGKIEVRKEEPEEEDPYEWIQLYQFKVYSVLSEEVTNAFLAWKVGTPEGDYINDVILRYLTVIEDDELPQSERHVFLQDLGDPPDELKVVFDDEVNE